MAYSDFTLEEVVRAFQLTEKKAQLFENIRSLQVSSWLKETLDYSLALGLQSGTEKARSEFIISPILLEITRKNSTTFTIYSGKLLNVDKAKGLIGECDFILSKGESTQTIQTPIVSLVEAKKQDMEMGLGQCSAQMVAAQLYNQQRENTIDTIFGCVTTGENWRFLKLRNTVLVIDSITYYIIELDKILGVFQTILDCFIEQGA